MHRYDKRIVRIFINEKSNPPTMLGRENGIVGNGEGEKEKPPVIY